jgi:predicted ATPase
MISLSPLDGHQVRRMVGELAARHALPKEVVDGVTERTGGVPLFVEEVTRLWLECFFPPEPNPNTQAWECRKDVKVFGCSDDSARCGIAKVDRMPTNA